MIKNSLLVAHGSLLKLLLVFSHWPENGKV